MTPHYMDGRKHSLLIYRYGGAALLAAIAIAARIALATSVGGAQLMFFYFACAASAWMFDMGPGLLTVIICYAAAILVLYSNPRLATEFGNEPLTVGLSALISVGLVLIIAQLEAGERRLAAALGEMSQLRRIAEQQREAADQANRDKAEYLAIISHELRNPLNTIALSASALRRNGIDDAARWFDRIDHATFSLSKMVERLLESARIDNRQLVIARQPFGLNEAFVNAIDLLRPIAESKHIKLNSSCPGASEAMVDGDAERIQEAISNLIGNAIKFTPEGGNIEVAWSTAGDTARVSISDSGVGIDPEFLPHVFDRFTQDRHSVRSNPGLGLGLFIVKHVVELHGGKIEASSAGLGKGATFTISLPTTSAKQSPELKDAG
jgi:signal transduction histidine kinase